MHFPPTLAFAPQSHFRWRTPVAVWEIECVKDFDGEIVFVVITEVLHAQRWRLYAQQPPVVIVMQSEPAPF
jgi:hypothetical protein